MARRAQSSAGQIDLRTRSRMSTYCSAAGRRSAGARTTRAQAPTRSWWTTKSVPEPKFAIANKLRSWQGKSLLSPCKLEDLVHLGLNSYKP